MTDVNGGSPTKQKILVAGASGRTGAAVVAAQLREKNWPVRAIVRTKDARSDRLERLGAEIAVADLSDIAATEAAMTGKRRAYSYAPFEYARHCHRSACSTFRRSRETISTASSPDRTK